jgi:hypothetical protein
MTAVATQTVKLDGTAPTFAAAATGDTYEVGTAHKLIVRNGAGSSMTVTVAVPGTQVSGAANDSVVYTIPATTGEKWIPLYDYLADPTDGRAHVTYSSTTTVTRASVKG